MYFSSTMESPRKEILHTMMAQLNENSQGIPEGLYLQLCNHTKALQKIDASWLDELKAFEESFFGDKDGSTFISTLVPRREILRTMVAQLDESSQAIPRGLYLQLCDHTKTLRELDEPYLPGME